MWEIIKYLIKITVQVIFELEGNSNAKINNKKSTIDELYSTYKL